MGKLINIRYFFLVILVLSLSLSLSLPGIALANEVEDEQFHTAAKAFSDQFYDASFSLFERFIKDFPKSSLILEAKLYLAKCYYYKQNYPKALKILSAIETKREATRLLDEIYYWLGIIYFKGKDFDKATNYTKRIIDNYPDSKFRWPGYYLLAESSKEAGNLAVAQEAFLTIIEEASDSDNIENAYLELFPLYLTQGKHSQLIALVRKYLKKFNRSQHKSKAYFYLAESYYAQGEWNKAVSYYQKALRIQSDSDFRDLIYQGLGFTYIEQGNSLEAKIAIDKIKNKQLRLSSQGAYYFKSKDYIQALETFNMFIRDYPESGLIEDAYLNKADILYELGRLNDAVYVYKYILDNFSRSNNSEVINKAHYGLAWTYLKNGKFKKAIDEFKNTLEYAYSPMVKVSSQIHIADAYQETAKFDEALDMYSDILENHPNTIYADYIQFQIGLTFLKKKELEKAFLALKNLTNNFSSSKLIPQAQYYLAVGYFTQADYTETKSLLEDFAKKFPQDDLAAKARYLYGKCFFNQKNYQKALRIFKEVMAGFSDREIEELSLIDIGTTYLHLLLNESAKKTWLQFLKKYPHSQYRPSVSLRLGGLYEKEGNFTEAQKYYNKVFRNYKDSSWAHEATLALGHLYWNNDDLKKAESYFQSLSKKQTPAALKAKLYLAKVLTQKEEHQAALNIYDQLSSSESPIAKVAHLEKAFLLKEMKEYRKAITNFKQAIASNIDTQELRFSLGVCLEKIGEFDDAVEQYFKAIYNFDQNKAESENSKVKDYKTKSFFRIAKIYERDNNIDEAKKIYQRIVDSGVEESKIAQARLGELSN